MNSTFLPWISAYEAMNIFPVLFISPKGCHPFSHHKSCNLKTADCSVIGSTMLFYWHTGLRKYHGNEQILNISSCLMSITKDQLWCEQLWTFFYLLLCKAGLIFLSFILAVFWLNFTNFPEIILFSLSVKD